MSEELALLVAFTAGGGLVHVIAWPAYRRARQRIDYLESVIATRASWRDR
jgi:hypothetical protein